MVKNQSPAGDAGSVHGSGRSPGGGSGNSLHYFLLGNFHGQEPDGLQSLGSQRVGQATEQLSMHRVRAKLD